MINKKIRPKHTQGILVICLIISFMAAGCSNQPPGNINGSGNNNTTGKSGDDIINEQTSADDLASQLAAQSQIRKFDDYGELEDFLDQGTAEYPGNAYLSLDMINSDLGFAREAVPSALPMQELKTMSNDASSAGAGPAGSADYSQTNIQVEGVDEADIIKTDGKYIYALVKSDLFIVDAYPAEQAEILAKISFKSRPQDMFINSGHLIIFGRDDAFQATTAYKLFPRRSNYTFFKVFDISDPKNPKQVRDIDIEGNYSDSRMIGDYVYLVTNNYGWYRYDNILPVPRILENGNEISSDCSSGGACYHPDVYYFDIPYQSYNFTGINAINVVDNSEAVNGEVYMLNGSQDLYVSPGNIYITYTKYISEYQLETEVLKELVAPRLKEQEREKIDKIELVENYILSPDEKLNKISAIIGRYISSLSPDQEQSLEAEIKAKMKEKYQDLSKELEKTVIHKIAITAGKLEYKTHGEVTGQVLNQFSMDEHGGFFRMATTKSETWSRYDDASQESYNNLYVLDENLRVVGALEGLAGGERIYSARFIGNRAYLTTFKQTDPLFVIDLSEPAQPMVLGQLEMPGYSDYLHPYDENTLIGFGKDTAESEWGGAVTKGLKLTLFDVSDVANPKVIDTYIIGDAGSDSIALSDHKAFLFSREKNLLSLPVSIRELAGNNYYGKLTFSGAAVFKVDQAGFRLLGKIDHSDGGYTAASDYWDGVNYYDNTVKRSLYIDDTLYTFSNQYIKMNKIKDLAEVKVLKLEKNKTVSDDFDIVN